jgi:hypothetical protein
MKYVIDIDALIDCLDCVRSIRTNGDDYISIPTLKAFIDSFPKDKLEYTQIKYSTTKQESCGAK